MRLNIINWITGCFVLLTISNSCKNDYADLKEGATDHGYHFIWARNEKTPGGCIGAEIPRLGANHEKTP